MVFPLVLFSSSAFLHTVLRMGRRGNSQIRRRENHVSAPHSSRSCFRERWTLATAGGRPSVRLSDHYLSYAADLARTPPPRLAPGCVVQQTWMTYVMRSAPRQVGEGRREGHAGPKGKRASHTCATHLCPSPGSTPSAAWLMWARGRLAGVGRCFQPAVQQDRAFSFPSCLVNSLFSFVPPRNPAEVYSKYSCLWCHA